MNDLHRRVHTGVCAAGGDHVDFVICDDGETFFHDLLNAARMILRLPTGKVASVVFKAERNSRHSEVWQGREQNWSLALPSDH